METIKGSLKSVNLAGEQDKGEIVDNILESLESNGYDVEEVNSNKPWGAYLRMNNSQAEKFVNDFFENVDIDDARLGRSDVELSPKILLVAPEQRLSWQYHDRRSEKWTFLTEGAFHRSNDDTQGELLEAGEGEIVQFNANERHRLVGPIGKYALVAEIWQHLDPNELSDEEDIVRVQDDYER